ncbi:MAG: hypothetical protein HY454_03510 [Parcubacteria group bacterium]|nr:hypothetical protein [Parcubacteria group bacterium]
MDTKLEETIKAITEKFDPVSIFLYGSRARTDSLSRSDYEIGVLHKRDKKISRTELKEANQHKNIVLYPFEYEDFLAYKIDTPFPENIYFRELVEAGKTLYGEKVIENLKPPKITTLDLLQRIRFDTGFALAAVLSKRNGDEITAATEFPKSCLFGVRCLTILETKSFPLTYDDIYEQSKRLDLGEYRGVVDHAFAVRKGEKIDENFLYRNVSLLNKIIKNRILESFRKEGNRELI